ncbi:MAG: hypothetical protein ACREC1_09540 [Methylovirgula sp.]
MAAVCGFVGSLVPLALCASLPQPSWIGLAATIALLGILGAVLARSFYGPTYLWAIIMMLGGVALACIGAQLNITGAG